MTETTASGTPETAYEKRPFLLSEKWPSNLCNPDPQTDLGRLPNYTWKDSPQPQVLLTLGLWNLKPAPVRLSM